jgi:hypothetical protein
MSATEEANREAMARQVTVPRDDLLCSDATTGRTTRVGRASVDAILAARRVSVEQEDDLREAVQARLTRIVADTNRRLAVTPLSDFERPFLAGRRELARDLLTFLAAHPAAIVEALGGAEPTPTMGHARPLRLLHPSRSPSLGHRRFARMRSPYGLRVTTRGRPRIARASRLGPVGRRLKMDPWRPPSGVTSADLVFPVVARDASARMVPASTT